MKNHKMKWLFVFGLCIATSVACASRGNDASPGSSTATRTPGKSTAGARALDSRPVVDTSPYWCDVIPKEALRRIGGAKLDLTEFRSPDNDKSRAVCGVRDGGKYGLLGVTWDLTKGRELIASSMKRVAADNPERLPASLGSGFTAYSPTTSRVPYEAAALFRCGDRESWIYIAVRSVSEGRDATRDLTDLMRIAQQRFGKIHHCTLLP
jgi:hypothetical protein